MEARRVALVHLRRLEARLRAGLGSERLALPNLMPYGTMPYLALRLRGKYPADALPGDGREIVVLRGDGELAVARRVVGEDGKFEVEARPATDLDLLAEDLEYVLIRIRDVLLDYLAKSARSEDRYRAIVALAERLDRAFES